MFSDDEVDYSELLVYLDKNYNIVNNILMFDDRLEYLYGKNSYSCFYY